MKSPCETTVWYFVPIIRKELAKSLIKNHGLTQRKAAEKLGLSEATVSQYLSKKRGDLEINDKDILKEIEKSAKRISEENSFTAVSEICRVCNLFKSSGKLKWCENHGFKQ